MILHVNTFDSLSPDTCYKNISIQQRQIFTSTKYTKAILIKENEVPSEVSSDHVLSFITPEISKLFSKTKNPIRNCQLKLTI